MLKFRYTIISGEVLFFCLFVCNRVDTNVYQMRGKSVGIRPISLCFGI